jgi:hypothetical protein
LKNGVNKRITENERGLMTSLFLIFIKIQGEMKMDTDYQQIVEFDLEINQEESFELSISSEQVIQLNI